MARRGRPKGGDSAETRIRIIDAARTEFAARGFDGASIATVAARSELAPSAVYHYFGGKVALYEEVYNATAESVWSELDAVAANEDSLVEGVRAMLDYLATMPRRQRSFTDFLALVPMETSLHPEFAHILEWRTKRQNDTFVALAAKGLQTGEMAAFTLDQATEILRSLLMGGFLEAYFQSSSLAETGDAVLTLLRVLDQPHHSKS